MPIFTRTIATKNPQEGRLIYIGGAKQHFLSLRSRASGSFTRSSSFSLFRGGPLREKRDARFSHTTNVTGWETG